MDTEKNYYIARSADVIGDVHLEKDVSIWYQAVLRAEEAPIRIGAGTNIQDACVLHTDEGFPVIIGEDVTVGHGAIIHGCEIGDNSLIGMGAIVLNGAKIGKNCVIGAGTLVTGGKEIPDGHMAFGNPMKIRREVTEGEIAENHASAEHYKKLAKKGLS